jgi:hypothetical protein
MAHGFATLWLSGAFPDRDKDPTATARLMLAELHRAALPGADQAGSTRVRRIQKRSFSSAGSGRPPPVIVGE